MVGRTVSHYRVLDRLGGGGMGIVYRAEDLKLGRVVALKFLPDGLVRDPQALERFRREARAASALNHPGICTIFDFDEADGTPFLVMEYLEGQTLEEQLAAVPLSFGWAIEVAIQVAEALEAAHARGVVHRNVKKPANIFVLANGGVKVLDFGLALRLSPQTSDTARDDAGETMAGTAGARLTSPGLTLGTVAYMSPEQALGTTVDARSDLFSFGVVLYRMATGALPFQGKTAIAAIDAILHQPPPTPIQVNPLISPGTRTDSDEGARARPGHAVPDGVGPPGRPRTGAARRRLRRGRR